MGFLGVIKHKRKRKGSPAAEAAATEKKRAVYHPLNIQDLPAEVLQNVLVYSGNLNLPQASPILASKLKRRRALEKYLLSEQAHPRQQPDGSTRETGERRHSEERREGNEKMPGRVMSTAAAAWPFVTARDLAKLDVQEFETNFVPWALEKRDSDQAVRVVMYMVSKGCLVEEPAELYVKVLKRQWLQDATLLCDKQFVCDHRAVILAMELGAQELAARLIGLDKAVDSAEEVWAHATRVNNQPVLDFLGASLLKSQ